MKKWIIGLIIAAVVAYLLIVGFIILQVLSSTVAYGTPHHRPKVE